MPPSSNPPPAAGLWRRLGAMLYDGLLLLALWMLVTAIGIGVRIVLVGDTAVRGDAHAAVGGPLLQVALLLTPVCFYVWFWTRAGRTLGMQAWNLRLDAEGGGRVSTAQAGWRLLGALVSAACLGLGYAWILVDPQQRAWHDRWSRSRVVVVPRDKDARV